MRSGAAVDDGVAIHELVLRVPALAADEVRRLAVEVAQRVGEGLGEALPSRSLGVIELRVQVPEGTPPERLAERLAHHILKGLAR